MSKRKRKLSKRLSVVVRELLLREPGSAGELLHGDRVSVKKARAAIEPLAERGNLLAVALLEHLEVTC